MPPQATDIKLIAMPLKQSYGCTRPNYITSLRHPRGLFAELLTTGAILLQLTKVNNQVVISSLPTNCKHAILPAVKPLRRRLTKSVVAGLFWSSVMGKVIVPAAWQRCSNAVHSGPHPFPLKLKGRAPFLCYFLFAEKESKERQTEVPSSTNYSGARRSYRIKNQYVNEFLLFTCIPATTTFVYLNRKRHLC